jgi:hypothetical protein
VTSAESTSTTLSSGINLSTDDPVSSASPTGTIITLYRTTSINQATSSTPPSSNNNSTGNNIVPGLDNFIFFAIVGGAGLVVLGTSFLLIFRMKHRKNNATKQNMMSQNAAQNGNPTAMTTGMTGLASGRMGMMSGLPTHGQFQSQLQSQPKQMMVSAFHGYGGSPAGMYQPSSLLNGNLLLATGRGNTTAAQFNTGSSAFTSSNYGGPTRMTTMMGQTQTMVQPTGQVWTGAQFGGA